MLQLNLIELKLITYSIYKNIYKRKVLISVSNIAKCRINSNFQTQFMLFSAPEPKAQVHYCDHTLSVVRPSVRRPSVVNFHIFDFSSETVKQNSTKLYMKQDLNVLYQVCVFRADWKNKMAAPSSDWLKHF